MVHLSPLPPNHPRHRLVYLDFLRIIAVLGVIANHTGIIDGSSFLSLHPQTFFISSFFHTLSFFSVNVFFLISGALILKQKESWQAFYQKRATKIIIPFIFWSLIFFFTKQTQAHFWFLRVLIILYLLTPALRVWLQQAQKKQVLVFIFLTLLLAVISKPFALAGHTTLIADGMTNNSLFTLGLGLYVLGYYLDKYPLKIFSTKNLTLIITAAFALVFISIIAIYYLTGNFFSYPQTHEAITSIILALAIFTLAQKNAPFFQSLSPTCKKLINGTGGVVFGIYLIHFVVVNQVSHFFWETFPHIPFFPLNLVLKTSLIILTTFFICLTIVKINKKIPFLKHLL